MVNQVTLQVQNIRTDMESGETTLTGFDISEFISEIGVADILNSIEYSDIFDYVNECEAQKRDEDADYRDAIGVN